MDNELKKVLLYAVVIGWVMWIAFGIWVLGLPLTVDVIVRAICALVIGLIVGGVIGVVLLKLRVGGLK